MAIGTFGPENIIYRNGQPASGETVEIRLRDEATLATIYDGVESLVEASNPFVLEDDGIVFFCAEEGDYDMVIRDTTVPLSIIASEAGVAEPLAEGGDISFYIDPDSGFMYAVHRFNTTQDFTPLQPLTDVSYLVVGGGGGAASGGGGGGGVVSGTDSALAVEAFPVIVGAGGLGVRASGSCTNGSQSSFNGHIAQGGGHGGITDAANDAAAGASGGGAGATSTTPTAGALGTQGHNGGSVSVPGAPYPSAGGGGAGAAGGDGGSGIPGDGGAGVSTDILGVATYFGGGGAGACAAGVTPALGGIGGGGGTSSDGVPNTGGGGGGPQNDGNRGAKGASGFVAISYRVA